MEEGGDERETGVPEEEDWPRGGKVSKVVDGG